MRYDNTLTRVYSISASFHTSMPYSNWHTVLKQHNTTKCFRVTFQIAFRKVWRKKKKRRKGGGKRQPNDIYVKNAPVNSSRFLFIASLTIHLVTEVHFAFALYFTQKYLAHYFDIFIWDRLNEPKHQISINPFGQAQQRQQQHKNSCCNWSQMFTFVEFVVLQRWMDGSLTSTIFLQ